MIRFAILFSACAGSFICADDPVVSGPDLRILFSDDFVTDSVNNFESSKDVSWNEGFVRLSAKQSLKRQVDAGCHVTTELQLQIEKSESTKEKNEVQIWFELADGTATGIQLSQAKSQTETESSIAVLDRNPSGIGSLLSALGAKGRSKVIKQSPCTDQDLHDVRFEFRHGLLTATAGESTLLAYVDTTAQVNAMSVEVTAGAWELHSWRVNGTNRTKSDFSPNQVRAIENLKSAAESHYRKGEYSEAVKKAERELEIRQAHSSRLVRSTLNCMNALAVFSMAMGDHQRAQTIYEEQIDLYAALFGTQHPIYANTLNNLGMVFKRTGDLRRAESLLTEALRIRKMVLEPDNRYLAMSLNNQGLIYVEMGRSEDALPMYTQSIAIKKRLGTEPHSLAVTYNNLSIAYQELGDYSAAESPVLKSLEILKSVNNGKHPHYAKGLHTLGMLYSHMGDDDRALRNIVQSAEIMREIAGEQHPAYASSLNSIARLHLDRGNFAEAEQLFEQAIEIWDLANLTEHPMFLTTLSNFGWMCAAKGDYNKSLESYHRVKDVWQSVAGETHMNYARCLANIGAVHQRQKEYSLALDYYHQAMGILSDGPFKSHPVNAHLQQLIATVMFLQGKFEAATPFFAASCTNIRNTLENNSPIQSERQQKLNAQRYRSYLDFRITNAGQNKSDVRDTLQEMWQWKGAVTIRQSAYRTLRGNEESASLLKQLGSISRRMSVLLEQSPSPSTRESREEAVEQFQAWKHKLLKLRNSREQIEKRLASINSQFRNSRKLLTVNEVEKLLPEKSVLIDFLKYQHVWVDDAGDVKTESRYVAFVVRRRHKPSLVPLGSAEVLEASIDGFRRQIIEPNAVTTSNGHEVRLRALLWKPIEPFLTGVSNVLICPDMSLGTLPFCALPGTKPGSFLLEDYKIVIVPGAKILRHPAAERSPVHGLLMVGNVDYDAGLPELSRRPQSKNQSTIFRLIDDRISSREWRSLPGFESELTNIREIYERTAGADEKLTVLSGNQASESEFQSIASNFRVIHLVTHGYFERPVAHSILQTEVADDGFGLSDDADRGLFIDKWVPGLLSGLVFAGANTSVTRKHENDGILRAAEIESLSLSGVGLVVLSACETGLGAVAGGEGLTGLQRAFHIAGVRSVVASLWKVDDRATQELMRRFYTNLWVRKQPRIDALRNAQLWLLRHPKELDKMGVTNPATRGMIRNTKPAFHPNADPARTSERTSPYFWAPWVLSGDWR